MIIRPQEQRLITDWFTKKTYTVRYINFFSNHPINQKINTVTTMRNRILKLSNHAFHDVNLKKLLKIFSNNGYPKELLNKLIFHPKINQKVTDPTPNSREVLSIRFETLRYVPKLTDRINNIVEEPGMKMAKYTGCPKIPGT